MLSVHRKKPLVTGLLLMTMLLMCLIMLRLGVWQLDRAEVKRQIYQQQVDLSEQPRVNLATQVNSSTALIRFQPVQVTGRYLAEHSILIDNQVLNNEVGYYLLTPFAIEGTQQVVLINRGWLSAGLTREILPEFDTPDGLLTISGRLNNLPAKPPIWNDKFAVNKGIVWQFLPLQDYNKKTQLNTLPLMLELAPLTNRADKGSDDALDVVSGAYPSQWSEPDYSWVNRHKAYAVQWFALAATLLIASLILLYISSKPNKNLSNDESN